MTTSTKTLIVILGPTGSGKTDLSIRVAEYYGSPILSADSRQVFRGMPIGTAQPDAGQLSAVRHYFIADRDVNVSFSCGDYEQEALKLLQELFQTHDVIVVVGGSGLYIDALCDGMDDLPPVDSALRKRLVKQFEREGLAPLLEILERLDPEYYATVDRSNPQRVVRAVEVCLQSGRPYTSFRKGRQSRRDFRIVKIGTDLPREVLYDRINRRVDAMMVAGLEQEARKLYPYRALNALRTVGYRELFDYFEGKCSLGEAVELVKRNTRRYAKRQLTWFRRDDSILWINPGDPDKVIMEIEKMRNGEVRNARFGM